MKNVAQFKPLVGKDKNNFVRVAKNPKGNVQFQVKKTDGAYKNIKKANLVLTVWYTVRYLIQSKLK